MTQHEQSSEAAEKLMAEYGISHEMRAVYFYQGHKYDRLSDAVKYARDGLDRTPTAASASSD